MLDNGLRPGDFGNAPQRLAALVGLPHLVAEFGVPFDDVLRGFPVAASTFESDENRIPYGLFCQIMDRAAELTGCPHIGLLLGSRFDHRCMGLAGRWMANAPTLEAALTGFIALQSSATRGATAYLHRTGEDYILGYGAFDRSALGYVQNYATVMPVAFNLIRELTGGKATIVEVLFSFRKPSDIRPYRDFFGVPVLFDQPQTGVVFTKASLALPIPGANLLDFAEMQRRAEALLPPGQSPWSDRTRRMLRSALLRGETQGPEIAAALGVHPRALRRSLASERTTFRDLLAEVRFGAAQELLAVTDLSAGEIAAALCYANQPAFNQAFRTWSGMTPREWRQDWKGRQLQGPRPSS
ncbi:AraC family transcriptional regulator [Tabrizicola sp. J26]|uniref:AraC family transcriptional regulator n=1 Tax=Alitabrizicola rongguiensis TaxID=2909234 RepID=UPI001F2C9EA1|nr:AraC family transcriptional regulator [Tabrizicola rongguiensis]MCF1709977.1 AraC family transcriptional regulator [Tabrizicola rongguiensis]